VFAHNALRLKDNGETFHFPQVTDKTFTRNNFRKAWHITSSNTCIMFGYHIIRLTGASKNHIEKVKNIATHITHSPGSSA
jgi:hypothetical protein